VIVLRPMRPREELFVLRSACGGDVRSLCGGVAPGGGRIVQCLATNAASLSPACKDVLSQFSASQYLHSGSWPGSGRRRYWTIRPLTGMLLASVN
jgi:hypothetical protein